MDKKSKDFFQTLHNEYMKLYQSGEWNEIELEMALWHVSWKQTIPLMTKGVANLKDCKLATA